MMTRTCVAGPTGQSAGNPGNPAVLVAGFSLRALGAAVCFLQKQKRRPRR